MFLIRIFEEFLEKLFKKGELFGTTHSCIGQEAVAVGLTSALKKGDTVTSNHRGHGHFISFADDMEGLLSEIMGKKNGVCSGRSGSQHLNKNNFYSNGITGGMVPVAVGMAFAEKIKKTGNVIMSFFGDGALGEGVLYESFNIASLWKLPIIFVVENNYYAMSTHVSTSISGSITDRGKAFGINTHEISGSNVLDLHRKACGIVDAVRLNCAPAFVVVNTYRFCGHSKSDTCDYRSSKEENMWREKDPLAILADEIDNKKKTLIEKECQERLELAYQAALRTSFPDSDGSDIL